MGKNIEVNIGENMGVNMCENKVVRILLNLIGNILFTEEETILPKIIIYRISAHADGVPRSPCLPTLDMVAQPPST